jgi:hypothetical protein
MTNKQMKIRISVITHLDIVVEDKTGYEVSFHMD